MYFKLEDNRFSYKAVEKATIFARPHLHSQLEIVLLKSGSARCCIDKKEWELNTGDIAVVFPGQVHSYTHSHNDNDLLLASPDIFAELDGYFADCIPVDPIITAGGQNAKMRECIKKLTLQKQDEYSYAEAKGYFLILLTEILRNLTLVENRGRYTDTEKSILAYCAKNYRQELTLESVARSLHIGKYTVSHFFSSLGICFNDYINSLRIESACKSLTAEDLSISQIAYESGFGSIRTFNRAFLKHKGISPREYRLKKQNHDFSSVE